MGQVLRQSRQRRSPGHLPNLRQLKLKRNPRTTKTERVLELLRRIAQKNRQAQPKPFYSIRAVAVRFQTPTAAMYRLYRQLASEGIVRSSWGSKTMLEPIAPVESCKKTSSIPVSVARFPASKQYRNSILHRCLQLSKDAAISRRAPFNLQAIK